MYLNDSGNRGIQYDGNCFFISANNVAVRRYTDVGLAVEPSGGSQNIFTNCHVDGDGSVGAIGLRTIRPGTWVIGGEYIGGDAGIAFEAESDDVIGGGTIGTFHELRGTGITHREPGSGRVRNVHHYSPRANFATGLPELVRFNSCTDCTVNLPQVGDISTTGDTVVWDSGSTRCGMRATVRSLRAEYTDNGGFLPYVEAVGSFDSFAANNITKGVKTFVPSYEGQSAPTPAYHDGSNWYELSSAATQFSP
jgi:hypothetical protein